MLEKKTVASHGYSYFGSILESDGSPVSWLNSKKQKTIALSSTEVE